MKSNPSEIWKLYGQALTRILGEAPEYEEHRSNQGILVLSGEMVADLNYALIDSGADSAEFLTEAINIVKNRNLPLIVILTQAAAAELNPLALRLGLKSGGQLPLMQNIPEGLISTSGDFEIRKVSCPDELNAVSELEARAFEMPREAVARVNQQTVLQRKYISFYIALDNGIPVSTVQATRSENICGIWSMATPPEHQGKGAGRALLSSALNDQIRNGTDWFYLMATLAGQKLYESLGFRTIDTASLWVSGHSSQARS